MSARTKGKNEVKTRKNTRKRNAGNSRTAKRKASAPRKAPAQEDLSREGLPPFVDLLFPKAGPNHEPLIDDMLIVHPDFAEILEALEELDDLDRAVLREHGILFTGESLLGKTRLLAEYIAGRMPRRTADGLEMPVLYIQIAERPTIRSVAVALLREFGEIPNPKDSADDMLNTLVTLGAECGLHVICLDDLHHFVDQRSELGQYELTEWLKRLVMRMQVALVICGLERTTEAIRLNEQLYSRMDCLMQIRRFDWRRHEDRQAFEDITEGFRSSVGEEFILPKEAKDSFRWYVACSRKIGFMMKIGRRMIKLARRARTKSISLEILDKTWRRSRFDSPGTEKTMRPFGADFACNQEPATIERILNTGVELGPKEAKASKSKREKKSNLRQAIAR